MHTRSLSAKNKKPRTTTRRRSARQSPFPHLDLLEARTLLTVTIAATSKSATYTDTDGDLVTVSVTAGTLTLANFTTVPTGLGDQLEVIDLSAGGFDNANLTVTVKRAATGDGLANIGYINSSGHDMGTVSILGDLGRIDAGDGTLATPGLKSLSVRTLGRVGLDSQGGTGSLGSHIVGALSALTVKGDVQNAFVGTFGVGATLGAVTIGGSVIGGSSDHSGEIFSSASMGAVKITGDLQGSGGVESGAVVSNTGIVSVAVGGSLLGGAGDQSGIILATNDIGAVTVTGDIRGRTGTLSGVIDSTTGKIASVTVGGSLFGSSGVDSAEIISHDTLGLVKIARNVVGSSGDGSGSIQSTFGAVTGVSIGGSLIGNSGTGSGYIISALDMGAVTIKHDLHGGDGDNSGAISAGGKLASAVIGGSILGSGGVNSGQIFAGDLMGNITVAGDVHAGAGVNSGMIHGFGSVGNVTIGGSLFGGSAAGTGTIMADTNLGIVKIGGDVHGGSALETGFIWAVIGNITSVSVAGTLFGGAANRSGVILAEQAIGPVAIGGSIIGGGNAGSASISQTGSVISVLGRLTSVAVGGSIISGADIGTGLLSESGAVIAGADIGALTVKGSLIGNENSTANTFVVISAFGQAVHSATADLAIGKITIGGRVQFANILAGYDASLVAANADAQIGAVTVGGDWAGSNIVAGAKNTSGLVNFGDVNDSIIAPVGTANSASIRSQIASVTIKGFVYGTSATVNAGDHFGFVAESVLAVSVGGVKLTLNAAPDTDNVPVPSTVDVAVHEV